MRRIPLLLLLGLGLCAACVARIPTPAPLPVPRATVRVLLPPRADPGRVSPGAFLVPSVRLAEPEEDPALLMRLGETDAALVYGTRVARLREPGSRPVALLRAPDWDLAYVLWIDRETFWVNDPAFRRWLARSIARDDLVRACLAGEGEPLEAEMGTGPVRGPSPRSRPALVLERDAGDPWAVRLAARLRERLRAAGVDIELRDPDDGSRAALFLVPVPAGDRASLARELLETAPRNAAELGAIEGEASAALALQQLGRDARLVPLVRVHAWLALDARLVGVRAAGGRIDFAEARWRD